MAAQASRDPRPAVVTVHYHAMTHLLELLVTLLRIPPRDALHSVTVVDNGSTADERAILRALAAAGIIRLVERTRQDDARPGINAGISSLARACTKSATAPTAVWVIDSDVLVLRADVIDAAARALDLEHAAILGQLQLDELADLGGYAHRAR